MEFPLSLSFKILAFAPQISVLDAKGKMLCYVKQKLFKLKEAITVFTDDKQTEKLYEINADRIIDFSANYKFTDASGNALGAVGRKGMKSLWKAHYIVTTEGGEELTITEGNPWTKILDALFQQIPVVGMFSGYVLHPYYQVKKADGTEIMRLEKKPAFFEGKFEITRKADIDEKTEKTLLLSSVMLLLLERGRG